MLKRILAIAILLGLLLAGGVSFGGGATPPASAASGTVVPTSGIRTQEFRWNSSCRWDGDQRGYCHGGTDIAGAKKLPGNPVYAMAAGKVVRAGTGSFGCEVVIDHGDQGAGIRIYSLYGHMGHGDGDATGPGEPECYESYVKVSVGQSVSAGQLIGNQGNAGYTRGTGNPAGVHLHFSVLRGTSPAYRNAIDPAVCIGNAGSYTAGSQGLACLASSGGGGSPASSGADHFYTTSVSEPANAVASGYRWEGIAAYLSPGPLSGWVPLYRLWSGSGSDHFYTTSAAERDAAVARSGYVYEGVAGYVSPTPSTGLIPLYRLWSGSGGDHFYTTSAAERDAAVAGSGYVSEGVVGYVSAGAASGLVPFFRWWLP